MGTAGKGFRIEARNKKMRQEVSKGPSGSPLLHETMAMNPGPCSFLTPRYSCA